ncbi:unnamed protein product [Cuscuta campestris]|uniref:Ty3 transposon capsid-like protein domain-containing protein n=1 Tax=Cuscuta campestris TaxID=132261 RepID=A0A484L8M1_9ASTE|nr:unnamed protein product [Cuscuta campestris]
MSTIPEEHKAPLAAVHMDGEAVNWYHGLVGEEGSISWEKLIEQVLVRFDEMDPELIVAEFHDCKQITTVAEYIKKFEELKSAVSIFHKFEESYVLKCFVTKLREDIRGSVLNTKPTSLQEAYAVAKKHEAMIEAITKRAKVGFKGGGLTALPTKGNINTSPTAKGINLTGLSKKPTSNTTTTRKLLTAEE